MNERDMARILGAVLRQGRSIHLLSCAPTGAAILFLLLGMEGIATPASFFCALIIVILGVAEAYCAFRTGLDAQLFADIAAGTREPAGEFGAMDAALVQLNLMPLDKAGRPFAARRNGAVRLLKLQTGLTMGQIAAPIVFGLLRFF